VLKVKEGSSRSTKEVHLPVEFEQFCVLKHNKCKYVIAKIIPIVTMAKNICALY